MNPIRTLVRRAGLLITLLLSCALGSAESGLTGTYYDNPDFTGPSQTRTDPVINFTWNSGPMAGMDPEWWSVIWTGALLVPAEGDYSFRTRSDDGIQLFVNGVEIIDNWTGHSATDDRGTIHLPQGQVPIEVRFYNGHFAAIMQLYWSSSAFAEQIVPTQALIPFIPPATIGRGTGLWEARYSDRQRLQLAEEQLAPVIDYGAPGDPVRPAMPDYVGAVEWRGWIEPMYSMPYQLHFPSPLATQCFLDGALIADSTKVLARNGLTASFQAIAGRKYEICLRTAYGPGSGRPAFSLEWSCPLTSRQVIPATQLHPWSLSSLGEFLALSPPSTHLAPGWIEFELPSSTLSPTARVAGRQVQLSFEGDGKYYLRDQGAYGVPLQPGANQVEVEVQALGRPFKHALSLEWIPFDLDAPDYGFTGVLTARLGDTLLVSRSKAASALVLTGATGEELWRGNAAAGEALVVPLTQAGACRLSTTGGDAQALDILVIAADLRGPIADEVGFARRKDIAVSAGEAVWFGSSDPAHLRVLSLARTAAEATLSLEALSLVPRHLQVRLHGPQGPILRDCRVDPFIMRTTAERVVTVIQKYPDGSMLTQAELSQTPWIPDLLVRMRMVTSGGVFADGTLEASFQTGSFLVNPTTGVGTIPYEMILSGRPGSYLCHGIKTYQDGVLIGSH